MTVLTQLLMTALFLALGGLFTYGFSKYYIYKMSDKFTGEMVEFNRAIREFRV